MADKLTLDLEDNSQQAVQSFEDSLGRIDAVTAALADKLEKLTATSADVSEAQEQVVRVVNEETVSWGKLATAGAEATKEIVAAAVGLIATVGRLRAVNDLLTKSQATVAAGVAALTQSQKALNTTLDLGEKLALRGAAGLAGYGAAAGTALSVLSGFTVGLAAYRLAWANTGKVVDEETGKITTNLDRVDSAVGDLTSDFAALGAGAVDAARGGLAEILRQLDEQVPVISTAKAGWQEFDAATTRSVDQMVENMRLLGSAVRGVERDVVEASERVAQAQAASVDDFERVRKAEEDVAAAAAARAEAERVAGIQTSAAIDSEIAKLKERRGIAAANNQFDEQAQEKYVQQIEELEARRKQIDETEKQRREAGRKEDERQAKEAADYQAQIYEDGIERINRESEKHNQKLIDDAKKREQEYLSLLRARGEAEIRWQQKAAEETQKEAEKRVALAKAEQAARVKLLEEANGGNLLNQARQQIDPRAVARQVGAQRAAAAREQWEKDNAGKVNLGDSSAVRRATAERERMAERAGARGTQDVMTGRASQEEVGQAQNALIRSTAQQAAARGDLDNATARALIQATNNQQRLAQEQAQQAETIRKVQQALTTVGASVNGNQRARAQSGGFRG